MKRVHLCGLIYSSIYLCYLLNELATLPPHVRALLSISSYIYLFLSRAFIGETLTARTESLEQTSLQLLFGTQDPQNVWISDEKRHSVDQQKHEV